MSCCGPVKHIIKGFTALALGLKYEFTDARIRECRKCEENYWIGRILWCKKCKCCVPAAARVKEKKCALDKWDKQINPGKV